MLEVNRSLREECAIEWEKSKVDFHYQRVARSLRNSVILEGPPVCVVAWGHTLVFEVLCTGSGVDMTKEAQRTGHSLQTLRTSFLTKPDMTAPFLTPKPWSTTYWERQKPQPL